MIPFPGLLAAIFIGLMLALFIGGMLADDGDEK